MLVSASAPEPDKIVEWIPSLKGRSFAVLDPNPSAKLPDSLHHSSMEYNTPSERESLLLSLFRPRKLVYGVLQSSNASLVFVKSADEARRVSDMLRGAGVLCEVLAGRDVAMPELERESKKDRAKVLHALSRRRLQAIVCTDVMARGVDLAAVTHVINWDMPADPIAYQHRAGRAARVMGSKGTVINLVSPSSEPDQACVRQIGERFGVRLTRYDGRGEL